MYDVEFAEYPTNISLPVGFGEKAVFRCRHQSAEVFIVWTLNRSQPEQFSDITIGSLHENSSTVFTLTIPARSEYNGTVVVCRAFLKDGSSTEATPPVMLTIIAGVLIS